MDNSKLPDMTKGSEDLMKKKKKRIHGGYLGGKLKKQYKGMLDEAGDYGKKRKKKK